MKRIPLSAAILIAGFMTIVGRVPLDAQEALTAPPAGAPADAIEQSVAEPSFTEPSATEPSPTPSSTTATFWVSGYVASWTLNMGSGTNGNSGNMPYRDLDLSAMTHVIMFAAAIGSDGSVTYNSMVSSRRKPFNDYVHSKGKPILMSIGGAGNTSFSTAMSSGSRTSLVRNLISSMRTEQYDGIDIDIEPVSSGDLPNIRLFVRELRDSLNAMRAYYDPSKKPIITAAVYNQQGLWAELSPYIDQVNIMSYDYFGEWFGKSWHNNAPYGAAGDIDVGGTAMTTVENKAARYLSAGMPGAKLGVGVDFNGYAWKGGMLSDGNGVTAPRQRWTSAPVQSGGELPGWQIVRDYVEKYPSSVHYDNTSKVPYIGIDNAGNASDTYVTYQDASTAKEIVRLARNKGLGGVILWEIGGGYFGPSQFPTRALRDPLLQAVKQEAFGGSAPPPPVSDLTAPVVTVTGPAAGSNVTGTVNLTATASDNVGVASVQFLVNGTALGAAVTAAPYSRSWSTTALSNGSYEITATARDAAGNTASSRVTVRVANSAPPAGDLTAPVVTVTGPAAGSNLTGTVNLTATATDNVGVASVQFLVNGTALGAAVTAAPYTRSWNTATGSNGSYEITATARDAAGNTASSKVTVRVTNSVPVGGDLTAPVVTVTGPAAGSNVTGTVNLTATATDNVGVASVQFLVNGTALGGAVTAAPYTRSWNTTTVSNGPYEITATARDAAGNTASSKVTVRVTNSTPAPVGNDLVVFADQLAAGWIKTPWSATLTFGSPEQAYEGNSSIKVEQGVWGAMSLHSGSWWQPAPIVTPKYSGVRFAVYGGPSGAEISVMFENDAEEAFPTVGGGSVAPDTWEVITVPISELNPSNLTVHRLDIMEKSGTPTTYYLDDIRFVTGPLQSAAAKVGGTEEVMEVPATFGLAQNYPNPFNPSTMISYDLAGESEVTLEVFNALGQSVGTIAGGLQSAGRYETRFDASSLAGGVYFYRLTAVPKEGNGSAPFVEMKKMILVK